ncbi:hypothetical protein [Amycolatopsis australiensis]|uniref:Uncharacterized protein n=1 Tax=Amycolatopsis australiensis TaxID=546364 RepID=A0A1K1LL64_9PSEU|nr:hypothetical protein [Amycolatopsis australiensis]SFW11645.1 hypothetical protein SAMN04489730_0043 [Amycolatopsis australiensis]
MPDTLLPDPAEPSPAAAVLRRERTRWIRREADLNQRHAAGLGNVTGAARIEARTAHLVLTYALSVVEGRSSSVGSFDDLVRPNPPAREAAGPS